VHITRVEKLNLNIKKNIDKINLNEASSIELTKVPSIGSETAKKIICYRSIKKFDTLQEIINIKGIGRQRYQKIKKYLYVKK